MRRSVRARFLAATVVASAIALGSCIGTSEPNFERLLIEVGYDVPPTTVVRGGDTITTSVIGIPEGAQKVDFLRLRLSNLVSFHDSVRFSPPSDSAVRMDREVILPDITVRDTVVIEGEARGSNRRVSGTVILVVFPRS